VPVVVRQIAATMNFVPASVALTPGGSTQVGVVVTDQNGDRISNPPVNLATSVPGIVTISTSGTVQASATTGSGLLLASMDSATAAAGFYVGSIPAVSVVHTTQLGTEAAAAAVSPAGVVAVTESQAFNVVLGTLPAYDFPRSIPLTESPSALAFDHAGARLFVSHGITTSAFDTGTGQAVLQFTERNGFRVHAPVLSTNDAQLFVDSESGVCAYDLIAGTFPVCRGVISGDWVALDTVHSRVYITDPARGLVREFVGGGLLTAARIFDVGFRSPIQTGPVGLAASPDGAELYATSGSDAELLVFNLENGTLIQKIPLGGVGLAVAASSSRIAVSVGGGTVKIFDRASRVLLNTITVSGTPGWPAWNAAGTTLVVPNLGGWVDFVQ